MASKKFTQFDTANNTSETELSVGVKSGDNFKRLNFLTATTNPTVNDDNGDGYTVGSFWFNASTGTMYICKDSTIGAAVWTAQGASGITSNDGSITIDNTDPSAPDLSSQFVISIDGSNESSFRSTNGIDLFARLNGANFEQPFAIKNDSLIAKIGFFDKSNTNVLSSQAASISDATDEASAITAINSLLAAMRAYGLIAE